MSDISDKLTKILTGVYGRDIRQAIHDAIEQCHLDIDNPALTADALQRAVQSKIDDGTIPNLTLADGSVTNEKLSSDLQAMLIANSYYTDEQGQHYQVKIGDDGQPAIKKTNLFYAGRKIVSDIDASSVEMANVNGKQFVRAYDTITKEYIYRRNGNYAWDTIDGTLLGIPVLNTIADIANLHQECTLFFTNSNGIEFRYAIGYLIIRPKTIDKYWPDEKNGIVNYVTTSGAKKNLIVSTPVSIPDSKVEINRLLCAAYSFSKDGQVSIYINGILAEKQAAPSDFKSWDFTMWKGNFGRSGNVSRFVAFDTATTDAENYEAAHYILDKEKFTQFKMQKDIYAQIGDRCNLYAIAEPQEFITKDDELKFSVQGDAVSLNDSEVTCLSNGTAEITVKQKNLTDKITIHVGEQVSNEEAEKIKQKATQKYTDIVLVNWYDIPNPLYVGDEFALYAVGIDETADVPYQTGLQNYLNYTSSDPSICSVEFGTLHANKAGKVTITISSIDGTVTKTVDITTADRVQNLADHDIYYCDNHVHDIYNNCTESAKTTIGIKAAIKYAADNGYTCVQFKPGTYLIDPNNCPINVPSNMLLDFNGATVEIEQDNSLIKAGKAYYTFQFYNVENSGIINGTFYGDNYKQLWKYHVEQTRMIDVSGNCKNLRFENSEFSYSAGFNVGIGGQRKICGLFKLDNCEQGEILDTGEVGDEVQNRFRSRDFINISSLDKKFSVANFQGYGSRITYSRLYNIYFYDKDHNFMSMLKYCWQGMNYGKPDGAMYAKIMIFQTGKPKDKDPDFGCILHIADPMKSKDVYIRNCKFKGNASTAIAPEGGSHVEITDCHFESSGHWDPASAIDWEDGGLLAHSNILRNCYFESDNGQLIATGASALVIHDNIIKTWAFKTGPEQESCRIYRNQILGGAADISCKGNYVFANNLCAKTPTLKSDWDPSDYFVTSTDNTVLP